MDLYRKILHPMFFFFFGKIENFAPHRPYSHGIVKLSENTWWHPDPSGPFGLVNSSSPSVSRRIMVFFGFGDGKVSPQPSVANKEDHPIVNTVENHFFKSFKVIQILNLRIETGLSGWR